jgi:hypothetical protein
MLERQESTSPMTYARIAGVLYLVVFLIAPFAEFFVRQGLIVVGDPAATAANITASETMFRAGFVTDLMVFVIEVAQAAVLYMLFAPVSRVLAMVMAFARLAQATILGLNLLNMFVGLELLTSPEYAGSFDQSQLDALAYVFLTAQSLGYELGLVFFALHLGVLGYLVYRSGFLPKVLGWLLVGSALGYLANSAAVFLFPGVEEMTASLVVLTALVGELPLTVWLLVKGVDVERWWSWSGGGRSVTTLPTAPAGAA